MFWKRLLSFFAPSPGALTLLWAALVISLILSATAVAIAVDQAQLINSTLAILSFCALPAGGVLLAIATFIERKPGARVFLWSGVSLMMAASIGMFALFETTTSDVDASPLPVLLCACGPILLVPAGILLFLAIRAYPALRQTLRAARAQRIFEMIQARGEVRLAAMCAELSLDVAQTQKLIRALIAEGELMAYLDEENQLIYSAAALGEKQRRLLAMVKAKGRAQIDELAAELKVRRELVRQWTYALAGRRQLHGFVDWAGGIYSQDVEKLIAQNQCPHCGGQLEVAGKGLIQCQHCGVEVFQ